MENEYFRENFWKLKVSFGFPIKLNDFPIHRGLSTLYFLVLLQIFPAIFENKIMGTNIVLAIEAKFFCSYKIYF